MLNIKHVYELVKTKVSRVIHTKRLAMYVMLFLTSLCPDV